MAHRTPQERRFTTCAIVIVEQAPKRAGDRGLHDVDGSIYLALLLWSLIRWERKLGLVALETMGVELERLARQLDELLRQHAKEHAVMVDGRTGKLYYQNTREPYVPWDYDVTTQPVFDLAEQEARNLHHDWVGSEHLLLAIITSADGELKSILDEHLMTSENVRATIHELLGS